MLLTFLIFQYLIINLVVKLVVNLVMNLVVNFVANLIINLIINLVIDLIIIVKLCSHILRFHFTIIGFTRRPGERRNLPRLCGP